MSDNKEIIALDDWEHCLLRPEMYVGSVRPAEEKIPIIRNGRITIEGREISVGFYKMFHEILDNAVDEAKRMKGRMRSVSVRVDSSTGKVSVSDTGDGFYKGTQKNQKTGKTNIETAMSSLRAGSNFKNEQTDTSLIGTNGVGASVVNVLSDEFRVLTVNQDHVYEQVWQRFETKGPKIVPRTDEQLGTTVSFVPRKKEFRGSKWDRDILHAQMLLKSFLMKMDPLLSKLEFEVIFDGEQLDLSAAFYPAESFVASTQIGVLVVHESFEHSGSLSFVNSAMCTGIHQRIINELINQELDDPLGHHFYENIIFVNLPPKLVRFRDQNKTKLDSTRSEIEGTIKEHFRPVLREFFTTDLFKRILQRVEDRKMGTEVKKLRMAKKKINVRNSPKYFPPSGKPESLFIVEGESAMGSILQKRDTKTEGVYRLKGKIKNVRSVSDLSKNEEIAELMQILDLDIQQQNVPVYRRVIIATDGDEDGGHICSLLVNLFFRWFPHIIDEQRLFRLRIPLMSVGDKSREYFYDKQEYEQWQRGKRQTTTMRFLKGLGSLSEDDWEVVMSNKQLLQIVRCDQSERYLEMAFGRDSAPRKKWLQGEFK